MFTSHVSYFPDELFAKLFAIKNEITEGMQYLAPETAQVATTIFPALQTLQNDYIAFRCGEKNTFEFPPDLVKVKHVFSKYNFDGNCQHYIDKIDKIIQLFASLPQAGSFDFSALKADIHNKLTRFCLPKASVTFLGCRTKKAANYKTLSCLKAFTETTASDDLQKTLFRLLNDPENAPNIPAAQETLRNYFQDAGFSNEILTNYLIENFNYYAMLGIFKHFIDYSNAQRTQAPLKQESVASKLYKTNNPNSIYINLTFILAIHTDTSGQITSAENSEMPSSSQITSFQSKDTKVNVCYTLRVQGKQVVCHNPDYTITGLHAQLIHRLFINYLHSTAFNTLKFSCPSQPLTSRQKTTPTYPFYAHTFTARKMIDCPENIVSTSKVKQKIRDFLKKIDPTTTAGRDISSLCNNFLGNTYVDITGFKAALSFREQQMKDLTRRVDSAKVDSAKNEHKLFADLAKQLTLILILDPEPKKPKPDVTPLTHDFFKNTRPHSREELAGKTEEEYLLALSLEKFSHLSYRYRFNGYAFPPILRAQVANFCEAGKKNPSQQKDLFSRAGSVILSFFNFAGFYNLFLAMHILRHFNQDAILGMFSPFLDYIATRTNSLYKLVEINSQSNIVPGPQTPNQAIVTFSNVLQLKATNTSTADPAILPVPLLNSLLEKPHTLTVRYALTINELAEPSYTHQNYFIEGDAKEAFNYLFESYLKNQKLDPKKGLSLKTSSIPNSPNPPRKAKEPTSDNTSTGSDSKGSASSATATAPLPATNNLNDFKEMLEIQNQSAAIKRSLKNLEKALANNQIPADYALAERKKLMQQLEALTKKK